MNIRINFKNEEKTEKLELSVDPSAVEEQSSEKIMSLLGDPREVGEKILRENNISNELLSAINITGQKRNNLCIALAKKHITLEILQGFLSDNPPWSTNQLEAMLTNEGIEALEKKELVSKDFCDSLIDDQLTPEEVLEQLKTIDRLKFKFFQDAASDFKEKTLNRKSDIFYRIPQDQKLGIKEDKMKMNDKEIAEAAIIYAKRHRKKGSTEIDNNRLSAKKLDILQKSIQENRKNYDAAARSMMQNFLGTKGINKDINPDNFSKINKGAKIHYGVESIKSTLLGNCSEMSYLVLDYLDQIGYDKPAYEVGIIGKEKKSNLNENHSVVLMGIGSAEYVVDPWDDKIFIYNQSNMEKHLRVWRRQHTADGCSDHQLVPYNSNKHEFCVDEDTSLEGLRLFRNMFARYCEYLKEREEEQEDQLRFV